MSMCGVLPFFIAPNINLNVANVPVFGELLYYSETSTHNMKLPDDPTISMT